MIKCKHCGEISLEPLVGYLYQDLWDDTEYSIDGFKCANCETIYCIEDGELKFWEFYASFENKKHNPVEGWAMSYN